MDFAVCISFFKKNYMRTRTTIKVPHGVGKQLMSEFKLSASTVSMALNGKRSSFNAIKVREKALDYGGVEFPSEPPEKRRSSITCADKCPHD
jgi:hypothetical protein